MQLRPLLQILFVITLINLGFVLSRRVRLGFDNCVFLITTPITPLTGLLNVGYITPFLSYYISIRLGNDIFSHITQKLHNFFNDELKL